MTIANYKLLFLFLLLSADHLLQTKAELRKVGFLSGKETRENACDKLKTNNILNLGHTRCEAGS